MFVMTTYIYHTIVMSFIIPNYNENVNGVDVYVRTSIEMRK